MIEILPRVLIREIVSEEPGTHNAILIASREEEVSDIVPNCKNAFCSYFGDTTIAERPDAPTREQVSNILEWAKDIEDLLISCQMGVSRSAAIGYLLSASRSDPYSALDILKPAVHMPNELILKLGEEILGIDIHKPIQGFYQKVAEHKRWKIEWVTKHYLPNN